MQEAIVPHVDETLNPKLHLRWKKDIYTSTCTKNKMILSPCNNSVFQWIYNVDDTENAILIACSTVLIPATIVANILVVYTVVKTKQIKQGVNDMFICLSISDTLIAVVSEMGFMVLLTAYRKERNCVLELWIQYSSSFLCNLSGMIIMLIAVDRYVQTYRAIKLRFDRRRSFSLPFMILSVFVAALILALDVLGTFMNDYSWLNMAIQLTQLTVIVSVCMLYILTYYIVSKNRREQHNILTAKGTYQQNRPNVPYIRAMIVTTIMILTSLLLCYFPLLITGIITALKSTNTTNQMTPRTFWNYCSFQFGFTSSLLSALVFLYRNRRCRQYITSAFKRKDGVINRHSTRPQTFVLRLRRSTKVNVAAYTQEN